MDATVPDLYQFNGILEKWRILMKDLTDISHKFSQEIIFMNPLNLLWKGVQSK